MGSRSAESYRGQRRGCRCRCRWRRIYRTIYGAVVSVGLLSEDPNLKVNIMPDVLFGAKTLQGQLGAGSRGHLAGLARFMEKHQLHPQIAQTFDFEEADKALQALVELATPGKIVVRI